MSRDAFGPNLRRLRLKHGVSLTSIAESSKISTDLLSALERNDFSRWPSGIYARSYIRQYARAIGADVEATVDEFCRWFPQGERRVVKTITEHAGIVNHELEWHDELPKGIEPVDRRSGADRRNGAAAAQRAESRSDLSRGTLFERVRRALIRA
jgi:transcriptional regulator with XRE-family HTH domain